MSTTLIPEKIVDLLNFRIKEEEKSSRLYYAMHEWAEAKGYFGLGKMMRRWSEEEMDHAKWSREFLEAYDFQPKVEELRAPMQEFSSMKELMTAAYKHEVDITKQCNELSRTCVAEGCYCALPLALKYMKEQTEELDKASSWLDRLDLVGDDPRELMMIDREMGGGHADALVMEDKAY